MSVYFKYYSKWKRIFIFIGKLIIYWQARANLNIRLQGNFFENADMTVGGLAWRCYSCALSFILCINAKWAD